MAVRMVIVEHPRIDRHLVDQTDDQDDDHSMIEEMASKFAVMKQIVENETCTQERRNEKDQEEPKANFVRDQVLRR